MLRLRLGCVLVALLCVCAGPAFADTIFTDSAFNPPSYIKNISGAPAGSIAPVNDFLFHSPFVHGVIASVDPWTYTSSTSGNSWNTSSPLIEQDGNLYMAWTAEDAGSNGSDKDAGLIAAGFPIHNFGGFGAGTPNFDGDPLQFGLGTTKSNDNYNGLDWVIHTVPLPEAPSAILLVAGLGLLGAAALVRKLKAV